LNKNVVVNLSAGSDDGGSDDGGGTDDGGTGSGVSTARPVKGKGEYTDRNQSYSIGSTARWKVTFEVKWNAAGYVNEETNELVITEAFLDCHATFHGETYPNYEVENGNVTTTDDGESKASNNKDARTDISATSEEMTILSYTTSTYKDGNLESSISDKAHFISDKAHCRIRCYLSLSCIGSDIYGNISFAILQFP